MPHKYGDKRNHDGIIKGVRDSCGNIILEILIVPPEQPELFIEAWDWKLGDKVEVKEK